MLAMIKIILIRWNDHWASETSTQTRFQFALVSFGTLKSKLPDLIPISARVAIIEKVCFESNYVTTQTRTAPRGAALVARWDQE